MTNLDFTENNTIIEDETKFLDQPIENKQPNEESKDIKNIRIEGPLSEVYTKALLELYRRKKDEEVVTNESQANDAIMAMALDLQLKKKELNKPISIQTLVDTAITHDVIKDKVIENISEKLDYIYDIPDYIYVTDVDKLDTFDVFNKVSIAIESHKYKSVNVCIESTSNIDKKTLSNYLMNKGIKVINNRDEALSKLSDLIK